ncbi:MAG: 30S ribosomal protein S17 [Bacteroidota bacterium]
MNTEETQPNQAEETAAPMENAAAEAAEQTPVVEQVVEQAAPAVAEEEVTKQRNERKTRIGVVVSDKMDKTIAVSVQRRLQHPIYGKYVKKSKKFIAHDENNDCGIGDTVRIMETRPMSRRKRWRLVQIIEKAK